MIKSSLNTIKKHSPIIIIEFSKYNLNEKNENYNFLNDFLEKFNYKIYSVNKKKVNSKEILSLIKNLKKRYQTIGNYYLIRSGSKEESLFLHE